MNKTTIKKLKLEIISLYLWLLKIFSQKLELYLSLIKCLLVY